MIGFFVAPRRALRRWARPQRWRCTLPRLMAFNSNKPRAVVPISQAKWQIPVESWGLRR